MQTRTTHLNPSRGLMILFLLLGSWNGAQARIRHNSGVNSGTPKDASESQGTFPTLTRSSFGFQCGTGKPTNCPNAAWPTSVAQPGMIRLWDSQVQWHYLNPGRGKYNWRILDRYLDTLAAHQPVDAMYTFGYTPCWDTKGQCPPAWGSGSPPDDLTANGSASFNAFVTALLDHCSAAGHCVKDLIKYWELWNEPNAPHFFNGSAAQLYSLVAPAVPIIRNKVSGAFILTPAPMRADTDWMHDWLKEENRGRLSDIFSFHLYLLSSTPEARIGMIKKMVDMKNQTSGWSNTPWIDSETNFDPVKFACDSKYPSDECVGHMVRWNLLQFAYGAQQVSWFFFNTTIGRNPEYANAYKNMMDWLVGGHFTAACSAKSDVYTCPFIQANGRHALLVWSVNGKGTYAPGNQYADYRDLSGNTTKISAGPVPIGVKPIMFEAAN